MRIPKQRRSCSVDSCDSLLNCLGDWDLILAIAQLRILAVPNAETSSHGREMFENVAHLSLHGKLAKLSLRDVTYNSTYHSMTEARIE